MSVVHLPVQDAQKEPADGSSAELDAILAQRPLVRADIAALLSLTGEDHGALISKAHAVRRQRIGNVIHLRGIVELSNVCAKNCYYCGIRKDNREALRFCLTKEQILGAVSWALEHRYGSVVLQAGERQDARFVSLIEETVRAIKALGDGRLGVTLSLGEQTRETYARWRAAGAHRYLLRIETSSAALYRALHPADHDFAQRVACLRTLRELGYQVGTGVMIGLPGQTVLDLADDVAFFRELDVDMIGMGPYVLHESTPIAHRVDDSQDARRTRLDLALRMIAVCRLVMPDINIASTTALQALSPTGREMGLLAGANIIMPIITPTEYRKHYQLYAGKPCLEDSAEQCQTCLEQRILSAGDVVGYAEWGDSPHALRRAPSAPRYDD
jgi:biotin synthase